MVPHCCSVAQRFLNEDSTGVNNGAFKGREKRKKKKNPCFGDPYWQFGAVLFRWDDPALFCYSIMDILFGILRCDPSAMEINACSE